MGRSTKPNPKTRMITLRGVAQFCWNFWFILRHLPSHQFELYQADNEHEERQQIADGGPIPKVNPAERSFVHKGQHRVSQVHWVAAVGHQLKWDVCIESPNDQYNPQKHCCR